MPRNPPLLEGKLNRLRVILECDTRESDTRVEHARLISAVRKLKKADVLPERERSRIGNDRRDRLPRPPLRGEGERNIDLAVFRKRFGVWPIDARPVARHRVAALIARGERSAHVVPVTHHEVGCIDEKLPSFLSHQGQRSRSARRKCFEHRANVSGIVGGRAPVIPVLEDDEDAVAIAIEARDIRVTATSAVEPDWIGSKPGGERDEHESAHRVARNLEEKLALLRVDVERNESVAPFHARGLCGNAGTRGGGHTRGGWRFSRCGCAGG